MRNASPIRIAVIGCGSIGRRHIENLLSLGIRNIIACDISSQRLEKISTAYGIKNLSNDYRQILIDHPNISAVVIAVPTCFHIPISLFFALKGVHLFIEKPLSHNLKGVDELIDVVQQKKLICLMAMCYRFHTICQRLKTLLNENSIGKIYTAEIVNSSYLPLWHPSEDYRKEYSAKHLMGGGVILTNGIHVFDLARWLFGNVDYMLCMADRVSNLEIDVEDVMECVLKMKNRMIIRLHVDFLRQERENHIFITGEKGVIEADIIKNTLKIWNVAQKRWKILRYRAPIDHMYIKEMDHFIKCIKNTKKPLIDINDGKKSLELALRAKTMSKDLR